MISTILNIIFFSIAVAAAATRSPTRKISVSSNPNNTRVLLSDLYGYSLEPVWAADYVQSNLTANLMSEISLVSGKAPPFRIGGTTSDETYLHLNQTFASASYPNSSVVQTFNISRSWIESWSDYFLPIGTEFVYCLNFADNSSSWANAVLEAKTVLDVLGSRLKLLELGNEVDHYISESWRAPGWDVAEYIPQWRNLTDQITSSSWYRNAAAAAAAAAPAFQAAVFADPPEVPDQQDEIDNFDIVNLTRGGLVDPGLIASYSVHLYPQSTCDTGRWYRMSLDLLSNHTVLWQNVSQYIPQIAAADAAKTPLVFGETNSVSCSGRSGISDTFGAALWGVDYALMSASLGIEKLYFHLGSRSDYSSFVPLPFVEKNETLSAGIRVNFYANYFLAHVVAGGSDNVNSSLSIAAIPSANSSDLSGYAIYNSSESRKLHKLVLLDMGVWNGTSGLSNPSTLSATDGTIFSNGTRPVSRMQVQTSWSAGTTVEVTRLNGPGTNAKSKVDVSGITFDPSSGLKIGTKTNETLKVGARGVVEFEIERAQGVLLELSESSK